MPYKTQMIYQMDPSDNTNKSNMGHVSSMNFWDDSKNTINTLIIQQSTLWTPQNHIYFLRSEFVFFLYLWYPVVLNDVLSQWTFLITPKYFVVSIDCTMNSFDVTMNSIVIARWYYNYFQWTLVMHVPNCFKFK